MIFSDGQEERFGSGLRTFIISAFEWMSLLIVVIPTLVALITLIVSIDSGHGLYGLMMLVLTFVGATFIAGGALTLLDVAENVRLIARKSSNANVATSLQNAATGASTQSAAS